MHWLKEYRLLAPRPGKRGGCGISRDEFAAMVRRRGVGCSPRLIYIIEHGGITHPRIADKIAAVAGATAAQRDSMVHKMHRGGWTPPPPPRKRSELPEGKKPQPLSIGVLPDASRAVVQVDVHGVTLGAFPSVAAAAKAAGKAYSTVYNRCDRRMSAGSNEFLTFDYTWRYADEWNAMTPEQRSQDIVNSRWPRKRARKEEA